MYRITRVTVLLGISLVLGIQLFIGCSKPSTHVADAQDSLRDISVTAFNQDGFVDSALTKKLRTSLTKQIDGINYVVTTSELINAQCSYVEVRYNSKTLSPKNVEFGNMFATSARGVLATAPLNHQGLIPIAQVLIGSGEGVSGSGVLFSVRFETRSQDRSLSGYNQKDSIVQNLTYDKSTDVLEWDCVFRGDANRNYIVDFADFGVVGANYNKDSNAEIGYKYADCDNNGKVDFSDFGVIGASYGNGIDSWIFFFGTSSPIDYATADAGQLFIVDPACTISTNGYGFKHFSVLAKDTKRDPALYNYTLVVPTYQKIFYANKGMECALSGGGGLAAPTNLQASDGVYPDKIELTWNKVVGATGYVIYRDTDVTMLDLTSDVNFYSDTTVPDTATHTYWIKATNGVLYSTKSTSDTGYKSGAALSAPTTITATHENLGNALPDRIDISWSEVPAATGYKVFRMDDPVNPRATLGKELTFSDSSISQPYSICYEYRVRAIDGTSESDLSVPAYGNLLNTMYTWNKHVVSSTLNEYLGLQAVVLPSGYPVIASHLLNSGNLMLFISTSIDPSAGSWLIMSLASASTTPVDNIDPSNPPTDFDMGIVGGNLMVARYDPTGDGSLVISASLTGDPAAGAWGTYPVKVPEAGKKLTCKYISIADLNNEPVVSYLYSIDGGPVHLEYARLNVAWPPVLAADFDKIEVDADDATYKLNYNTNLLVLSDGTPAIAYYKDGGTTDGTGLQFAIASNAKPISGEFSTHSIYTSGISGQGIGYFSSAIMSSTYPYIAAYNNVSKSPVLLIANAAKPASSGDWSPSMIDRGFTDTGSYASLADWSGQPFISHYDKHNKAMRYSLGTSPLPSSYYGWIMGSTTSKAEYSDALWTSAIIFNGRPAYAYTVKNPTGFTDSKIYFVKLTAP